MPGVVCSVSPLPPLCVCSQAPELDDPSDDPGAGPTPRATTPPHPLPTDPRRLSGSFVMGGGGKAAREPSVDPCTDYLGADLSQDSQLSASTLSQGSLPDTTPGDSTPTEGGRSSGKKKGSKKVKKKKVKT